MDRFLVNQKVNLEVWRQTLARPDISILKDVFSLKKKKKKKKRQKGKKQLEEKLYGWPVNQCSQWNSMNIKYA